MMPSRGLTAIDASRAAQKRAEQVRAERKEQWPYVHIFPPPNSRVLHLISSAVAVPALNATALILKYQVEDGMRCFLKGIIQCISGSVFTPGDVLWTLTVNEPIGITDVQGAPVQGLVRVPVPLGSWQNGVPWEFERAYEFPPNSLIQSTALNISGTPGAPNFLVSGFFGYLVPDVEVKR